MTSSMPARLLSEGDQIVTYSSRRRNGRIERVRRVLIFNESVAITTDFGRYAVPLEQPIEVADAARTR